MQDLIMKMLNLSGRLNTQESISTTTLPLTGLTLLTS